MANNFSSYAEKFSPELDKMIVQESKTGFLADNVFKAKFIGAKTVQIPEVDMVGLGNYDRATGYSKGDVNLQYKDYTLTQERSRQLYLDAQDADESGVPDLAGKLVGEFTRTQVIPEIDAYVLSKLYGVANSKSHVTEFTTEKAVNQLIATINSVEEACGYSNDEIVAMVDPTLYNALMNSTELQRFITASNFKQGEVDLKVKNLNGCSIIPVSSDRMKSNFVFDEGSTTNKGGFKPGDGAVNIRAIVLPKKNASLIKKVDKINMFDPNQVEDMDAYKINYRLYYDLLVKKSVENTIFAISG